LDASLLALLFGEDGLSRSVGLLDGALRMDAAERIRSLAADRAKLAGRLAVEGFGLLARRGFELLGHGRPRGLNGKMIKNGKKSRLSEELVILSEAKNLESRLGR
jgi:hypothetical protein